MNHRYVLLKTFLFTCLATGNVLSFVFYKYAFGLIYCMNDYSILTEYRSLFIASINN